MGSSSTIFCLGTSSWYWLARPSEISLLVMAPKSLPSLPPFDGGLTVRGLLGAAGLFLQVHGVDGVSRGEHGELAGQQEVSCIALGCVDELALFALTSHILR